MFNGIILSLGHLPGVDPGAALKVAEEWYYEVDKIAVFTQLLKNDLNLELGEDKVITVPWLDLNSKISWINKFVAQNPSKSYLCIDIHFDSGSSEFAKARPYYAGFYYGSAAGKTVADSLLAGLNSAFPGNSFNWVRHHTSARQGSLGMIRHVKPVSIVAECGFVSEKPQTLALKSKNFSRTIKSLIV